MDHVEIDEAAVHGFCEQALSLFRRNGFSVRFDNDLRAWCEKGRSADPDVRFTPAFDPNYVDLDEGSFIGVVLMHDGQDLVARQAIRLLETDDLVRDEIESMRIWQNKPCRSETLDCLLSPDDLPRIGGRVCHEGGAWVSPPFRRQGIAARLIRLVRAFAMVEWRPDWVFGFMLPHVKRMGVWDRSYGYARLCPLLDGHIPVIQESLMVYLSYMTLEEAVASLRERRETSECKMTAP